VTREIFSLRGTVRSGDSGGPLLGMDGRVEGVIFASSVQDPDTGYALTVGTVDKAAHAGVTASATVGTGTCSTH
jgi:S1-C subfamily serine protease